MARAPLAIYATALVAKPAIEQQLERVLTEDGEIKDDASPALRRIRRELRGAEGELVRLLDGQIIEDKLTGAKTCELPEQPGAAL